MPSFVKLFNSILDSTIWDTPMPTKITWITMMAMTDQDGCVWAAVPGLAKRAGVSKDECLAALKHFLSPDEDSRTEDFEGRRIEEIDGGWRLLNHSKYRKLMSSEDQREKHALRQRRYSERQKTSAASADVSADANDDIQIHIISNTNTSKTPLPPPGGVYSEPFETFWALYPRRVGKGSAWKAWKKLSRQDQIDVIGNGTLDKQKSSPDWKKDGGTFVPHPSTYLNARRWEDDVKSGSQKQSEYRWIGTGPRREPGEAQKTPEDTE